VRPKEFLLYKHLLIITLPDASKVKKLDITDNNFYKCRLFWLWLSEYFVFSNSFRNHFITTIPIELKLNSAIELASDGN